MNNEILNCESNRICTEIICNKAKPDKNSQQRHKINEGCSVFMVGRVDTVKLPIPPQ